MDLKALNTQEEYTWIIAPLDGTTNFIHGLPVFAISIALMKRNEVILGTVLDVKADECFYASHDGVGLFPIAFVIIHRALYYW